MTPFRVGTRARDHGPEARFLNRVLPYTVTPKQLEYKKDVGKPSSRQPFLDAHGPPGVGAGGGHVTTGGGGGL